LRAREIRVSLVTVARWLAHMLAALDDVRNTGVVKSFQRIESA
jgi:hypothetical protein